MRFVDAECLANHERLYGKQHIDELALPGRDGLAVRAPRMLAKRRRIEQMVIDPHLQADSATIDSTLELEAFRGGLQECSRSPVRSAVGAPQVPQNLG